MATPAPLRVWEKEFLSYRSFWQSNLLGTIVRPLFYLLGMGFGVGGLVENGDRSDAVFGDVSYFQFLGPAMIVTTAMMILVSASLWPIRGGFEWTGTYKSQVTTPITPSEVVMGVGLWHLTYGLISAIGVALVLAFFDSTRAWGLIPACGVAALTGAAYAMPITAWSAIAKTDYSFPNILRFVVIPTFLFAGAFYPISVLPDWLQWFARVSPLWHGIEVARAIVHHSLGFSSGVSVGAGIAHIGYLVVWVVVGWYMSFRAFTHKLAN